MNRRSGSRKPGIFEHAGFIACVLLMFGNEAVLAQDVPPTDCDTYAASKVDPQRKGEGVPLDNVDSAKAKRINKQNPDAVFASYLVRLRPKSKVLGALMSVFVESDDYKRYVMANVGGSAQPNANAQVLSNATLLVPKDSVGYSFTERVEPLFTQTENLAAQIRGLAKARDLLLPRLMDGRIAI
jgi:restriction endonuclease S subunit